MAEQGLVYPSEIVDHFRGELLAGGVGGGSDRPLVPGRFVLELPPRLGVERFNPLIGMAG